MLDDLLNIGNIKDLLFIRDTRFTLFKYNEINDLLEFFSTWYLMAIIIMLSLCNLFVHKYRQFVLHVFPSVCVACKMVLNMYVHWCYL